MSNIFSTLLVKLINSHLNYALVTAASQPRAQDDGAWPLWCIEKQKWTWNRWGNKKALRTTNPKKLHQVQMNTCNFYAAAQSAALPYLPVTDYVCQLVWKICPFCIKPIKIFPGRQHFNSPLDGPKQRLYLDLPSRRKEIKWKKP